MIDTTGALSRRPYARVLSVLTNSPAQDELIYPLFKSGAFYPVRSAEWNSGGIVKSITVYTSPDRFVIIQSDDADVELKNL